MSDVFYTPPAADPATISTTQPPFFTVSQRKLTVMFILTSGLYGLYWGYKHWSLYKAYSCRSLWPLPRTIFGLLYLPSLLYKVDGLLKEQGKGRMPYWAASAAGLTLLAMAPMITGFFSGLVQGLGGRPYSGVGTVLLVAASVIPFLLYCLILRRVQAFINLLNGDADGSQNMTFTRWNVLWMVIGSIYWIGGLMFSISVDQAYR